jgi:ribulose-5-phosphate 4-epimerase/fuculose-1-phosphate aldolase
VIDEGYTKFSVDWTDREALSDPAVSELERWRKPLFDAGLVGCYEKEGIGFGNISVRWTEPGQFIISGTQTGHLPVTGREHYAVVTAYDLAGNRVSCRGAVQASSETLTHAVIYELDPSVKAVVHVHDPGMWEHLKAMAPATRKEVSYGTPEMAAEFGRLFRETDFKDVGIAAMAGHESGVISIGPSLAAAATRVLTLHGELRTAPKEAIS